MAKKVDYTVLDLSLEQLELALGEDLLLGQIGAKPIRDQEKREIAQRWFQRKLKAIGDMLCANEIVQNEILSRKVTDRNAILATLVDVLSGAFGIIPLSALSAMIIKYGLEKLCCKGE